MTETRKLRVFLCHSSQDKPIVRELYQRLDAEGWIDPWLDEEKILPGQVWEIEVNKAVESADIVIVCLSSNSVTKEGFVQKELKKVLDISDNKPEGSIFVIPVRLDDICPPVRFKSLQYTDFFPADRKNKAFQLILMSLESHQGSRAEKKHEKVERLFSKTMLAKVIPNGIGVGLISLILLFITKQYNFYGDILILPFIGGMVASYRLVKTIPDFQKALAVKVGAMGGVVSVIPIALIFILFPTETNPRSVGIFMGILEAFAGLIGGLLASVYLLRRR